MERLSIQHHISKLSHKGKLHFSPIKEDGKILDLGTGTGTSYVGGKKGEFFCDIYTLITSTRGLGH